MVTFITSLALLVLGYVLYGALVDRVFGYDRNRRTPCYTSGDGVDYIPMPTWKVFLIQFLNIAGTGPIFGAIQGILFGPAAYLWIVLGCIFGGAVHDYMSGMISIRRNGASLPEIIGDELGNGARMGMRILSLVLMILVGTVFAQTPASLISSMTSGWGFFGSVMFWTIIVFAYYIIATLLPIDKLIGKIYPVFGVALLIMAVGVAYGIFAYDGTLPEITTAFENHHPSGTMPLFPGLFITIACGAVSGFHATQSPMMARCMKNEKYGRPIFYGAMITEGVVALIWAAAAIKFADSLNVDGSTPYEKLLAAMTNPETGKMNPAIIVNQICNTWLGPVGAILAILGVVAAPVTSGDTALRCARLIAADMLHYKQDTIIKRLLLCLPIFGLSITFMFVDFQIIWRYFAWSNQSLSVFTLWAITVWLTKRSAAEHRRPYAFLLTLIPALWMTMICTTYIFIAPEGFSLSETASYIIGASATVSILAIYIIWSKKLKR